MWRKSDLLSVGETNQKGLHQADMRTLKAQLVIATYSQAGFSDALPKTYPSQPSTFLPAVLITSFLKMEYRVMLG